VIYHLLLLQYAGIISYVPNFHAPPGTALAVAALRMESHSKKVEEQRTEEEEKEKGINSVIQNS
jgi:hypothetical protein